jgi:hypothetical protein
MSSMQARIRCSPRQPKCLVSLPLTQVGPWLRLAIAASGGDRPPKVLVYLCLRE